MAPARLAYSAAIARKSAGCRIPIMTADAPTAMARRKQIARRGRVDVPKVRFAQSQPPRASSSGRRAAHAALPPDTVTGRWSYILNFELLLRSRREKSIRKERGSQLIEVPRRQ